MLNSSSLNSIGLNGAVSGSGFKHDAAVYFVGGGSLNGQGVRNRAASAALTGSSSAQIAVSKVVFGGVAFAASGVFVADADEQDVLEANVAFTGNGVLTVESQVLEYLEGTVAFTGSGVLVADPEPWLHEATAEFTLTNVFTVNDSSTGFIRFTLNSELLATGYKYVDAPRNRQLKMSNKKRKLRLSR